MWYWVRNRKIIWRWDRERGNCPCRILAAPCLGRKRLWWKSLNSLVLSPSYMPFLLHNSVIVLLKKPALFFPSPQTSVVNYIDQRTKPRSDQLFFVVFEWKDPFIQTVQDVSNPLVHSSITHCACSWFVYLPLLPHSKKTGREEWGYFWNFSVGSSFCPVKHSVWRSGPPDAFPWAGYPQHSACS